MNNKLVDLKKYSFYNYSKSYPKLFLYEKKKLMRILLEAKIEHIGSTSVKNLGGKGIIDVMISVKKGGIKEAVKLMQKQGYILKHCFSKDRKYLEKHYKLRRVHLHITTHDHPEWKRVIAFRDYLRKNKDRAEEYAKVKKKAVEHAKGNAKKYKVYKKKFIDRLEKEALDKSYSRV